MCGRFVSARKRAELLAEFRVERDRTEDELQPDYNVAPTKPVYAVLTRAARGSGGSGGRDGRQDGAGQQDGNHEQGRRDQGGHEQGSHEQAGRTEPEAGSEQDVARELRVVRWGLVPSWAKDLSIGSRLINARLETVDSKPAFRRAFARRRCLLPADGFYEWQPVEEAGRTRKQPYFIHRGDGGILAFAGLYEIWRDSSLPEDHPGAWVWTAVIITTRAEDEVGRIHDRMPMVIEPDLWEDWLDPGETDAGRVRSLLAPAAAGTLTSYPVTTDVNSVRNNGPRLIEPQPGAPAVGTLF